jgi:hypothetical protein
MIDLGQSGRTSIVRMTTFVCRCRRSLLIVNPRAGRFVRKDEAATLSVALTSYTGGIDAGAKQGR